jgi:diguanylate cyclase (GGDEF)-like protein
MAGPAAADNGGMPQRATPAPAPAATALRLALRAWALLHPAPGQALQLGERALALLPADPVAATAEAPQASGWALLTRGFHQLYFATPAEARPDLHLAVRCFDAAGDRAGRILAETGLARALWRDGRAEDALAAVLPLRDEGLQVLKDAQRGVLLNTIAGCWSALGQSEQAFAYLYQALRDARPVRGHGFDTVLHCNLSHELLQLGDCHEALRHVDEGIERCATQDNPRLLSVLLINRVVGLTDLGRAAEALPDILQLCALPADRHGRGSTAAHFETLAIAALQAGWLELGADLVARARPTVRTHIADEQLELAVAELLLARAQGDAAAAQTALQAAEAGLVDPKSGASLRVRCMVHNVASDWLQARGDAAAALAHLRSCQKLHLERAQLASRARYQAAALQTELLRLHHRLEENDARRRATERARAELEAANLKLSQTVQEVQALQEALERKATRDDLTGLYNRRHLNDTLPALVAAAQRQGQPLAVVIIDLDHFKSVNDDHGHAAGDQLLAAFGRMLSARARKSDTACRYGGEEFCLLLPRTDAAAARRLAQALLRRWRSQVFVIEGRALGAQSFSAGVADTLCCPGSPAQLLKAADDELLAAKRGGRSRVLAVACAGADDGALAPQAGVPRPLAA